MKVYIVGAGPGAIDLITIRGLELLKRADVVIYAGSLVNPELLNYCKENVKIYDSAGMTLEEINKVVFQSASAGQLVVRLHTGDPSMYGAIQEQIKAWEEKGLEVEIVPGVSSVFAAAAALKEEFTKPGVTQTLILTRVGGKTPVPEKERLANLASHGASLAIFLSVHLIDQIVTELLEANLPPDTPVAVVQRVTWPDEKIVKGNLSNIAALVKEAKITKTALVLVGKFLNAEFDRSLLYHPNFSHAFREGS